MLIPLSGCSEQNTSFPSIGTTVPTDTKPSQPSGSQPGETDSGIRLTVALPFGEEALEAVRLLYLARKSGKLSQEPGQYIGQQVDLEDLRQFDSDFTVALEPVSVSTGATLIEIAAWEASAMLPDIIYCQDAASSLGLNQVAVLDDLLFDNPLLSAAHLYVPLLESARFGNKLYGIPYLASTPLVYLNQGFMSQFLIASPPRQWTWQAWTEFINAAKQAIDPSSVEALSEEILLLSDEDAENDAEVLAQLARTVFIMGNPAEFLPFLPPSIDEAAGLAMWDGTSFEFDNKTFRKAVADLSVLFHAGYTPLHLDEVLINAVVGESLPQDMILAGRILLWIGDSSDLPAWKRQNGLATVTSLMPSGFAEGGSQPGEVSDGLKNQRLPVTVRSLFISDQCKQPEAAADFASFIALDADSLLLQSRYALYEGLIPAIRDKVVWDALVGRQSYGSWLMEIRDHMPDVTCSGQQIAWNWQKVMAAVQGDLGIRLLQADNDDEVAAVIQELKSIAR